MAALTRRERKVKEILLKELRRINEWNNLSYSEKKYLETTLDVPFIDRELVKMRKRLKTIRRFFTIGAPIAIISFLAGVLLIIFDTFEFGYLNFLYHPLFLFSFYFGWRSLQRKIFIYEALRELSDADELDVVLDRASREADMLIQDIVDRELALEARLPASLTAAVRRN